MDKLLPIELELTDAQCTYLAGIASVSFGEVSKLINFMALGIMSAREAQRYDWSLDAENQRVLFALKPVTK